MTRRGMRGSCGLLRWVEVWTQCLARDLTAYCVFDGNSHIGWNALVTMQPVPDMCLLLSQPTRQFCLTSGQFDCFFQRFELHGSFIQRVLLVRQHLLFDC